VTDLERSSHFYDRVLGQLGFRRLDALGAGAPCWALADSDGGHFNIALQQAFPEQPAHNRRAPGLHHVAFHADTRADVDAFHSFLTDADLPVLDPPAEYDYTPGYYAVFFPDPDGMKLEVVFEPTLRGRV